MNHIPLGNYGTISKVEFVAPNYFRYTDTEIIPILGGTAHATGTSLWLYPIERYEVTFLATTAKSGFHRLLDHQDIPLFRKEMVRDYVCAQELKENVLYAVYGVEDLWARSEEGRAKIEAEKEKKRVLYERIGLIQPEE